MKKWLGALVALAMMGAAAPAQADPLLPGCYGAASVIVCDVSVGAETYETSFEVCAGSCQNVEITLVRTTDGGCVRYSERNGQSHSTCALESGSNGGYPYETTYTCSRLDVIGDVRQSLCIENYYDYYSGESGSCVYLGGLVRREIICS